MIRLYNHDFPSISSTFFLHLLYAEVKPFLFERINRKSHNFNIWKSLFPWFLPCFLLNVILLNIILTVRENLICYALKWWQLSALSTYSVHRFHRWVLITFYRPWLLLNIYFKEDKEVRKLFNMEIWFWNGLWGAFSVFGLLSFASLLDFWIESFCW